MAHLTLGYWGIRGLVQPIRFLLEYLELPFEDKKYTDPAVWQADKAQFLETSPLANIPYLKDGEKVVFESAAIGVYLAFKAGRGDLLGTTHDEKIHIQQIHGVIKDLSQQIRVHLFGAKDNFDATKLLEAGKVFFGKLEFLVAHHKWAAGENLTLADFVVFEITDFLRHFNEEALKSFPHLHKLHHHFSEIPQIKAYLHSERFQARPFFPPHIANWA